MSKPHDPVVLRVWRNNNDIFALFPVLPADNEGYHCTIYQHIGQHEAADYGLCIRMSRPARPKEARELLAELRSIGYRSRVYRRRTPAMRDLCHRLAHDPSYCA